MLELHNTHQMAHRNFSLSKMVLTDSYIAALIGFGHLAPLLATSSPSEKISIGRVGYQGPEILTNANHGSYPLMAADIFALGVCLFIILFMIILLNLDPYFSTI